MTRSFTPLILIALTLLASALSAQDAHYWGVRPGSEAGLLGGAVVASDRTTSAAFYNPARLAFVQGAGFSISANLYQLERLNLKDGLGGGNDITSSRFSAVPTMVSGLIFADTFEDHRFAYSVLTRRRYNANAIGRRQFIADVQPSIAGDENFNGRFQFRESMSDVWGGWSWSWRANEKLSIGLTHYVGLIDQEALIDSRVVSIAEDGSIASSTFRQEYGFVNVRSLFKLGIAWEHGRWQFGAVLSTPSFKLGGSGYIDRELSWQGIDADGDGNEDSEAELFRHSDLDATYKEPLSIALGAAVELGVVKLFATTEYFAPIGRFNVLESRQVTLQVSGQTTREELAHHTNGVWNLALAASAPFFERYHAYGSFRTDLSAIDARPGSGNAFSNIAYGTWDTYHLVAGVSVKEEFFELSFGLQYSWGDGPLEQPANFSNPREANALQGDTSNADMKYSAYTVLFGYTYVF